MYNDTINTSRRLDDEINSCNNLIRKHNDYLRNTKTFWKSDNGDLIRNKYNESLNILKSVIKKYNGIESNLNRLSNKILKAINAREQASKKP